MPILRIYLLGSMFIDHDWQTEQRATPSVQTLLAYLLLHRNRAHPRETLTAVLWGDQSQDRARSCLNTTLWRLRRLLEPAGLPRGTFLLTAPNGDIGFDPASDYWLDTTAFENQLDTLCTGQEAASTEPAAIAERLRLLYRGDLLEGFTDDWAVIERHRLRDRYVDGLAALITIARDREDLDTALACGQQALNIDPLREDIHRAVMRLMDRNGQRAQALRQFTSCREALADEIGVAPSPETRALFERIARRGEAPQRPGASARGDALDELYGVMAELDALRSRIRTAIDRLAASPATASPATASPATASPATASPVRPPLPRLSHGRLHGER